MTLFEVGVVIAVVMILALIILPAIRDPHGISKAPGIACINNLKQIGLAYRIWEGDNGDKYPMGVSVTNGGTMELAATGNVIQSFLVMSNELSTPRILFCPADTTRTAATLFAPPIGNSNVSYFVGVDVTNDTNPPMILSGDDNFEIAGVPVKSGLLEFSTNAPIAWSAARHKFAGNIGLADGSVQQVTTSSLHQWLLPQTGLATNRLAIP
jgi:prepilin-type processing-associated H-X9-DG protein